MLLAYAAAFKAFADQTVSKDGYSTSSECIRELIRADQARRAARELASLLREGLQSGEGVPVVPSYWAGKRRRIASRKS